MLSEHFDLETWSWSVAQRGGQTVIRERKSHEDLDSYTWFGPPFLVPDSPSPSRAHRGASRRGAALMRGARIGMRGLRAWASALAVVAGLAFAAPVSAAVLVSNIAQSAAGGIAYTAHSIAQGFTTGSSSGGYTLSDIEVKFSGAVPHSDLTVQLATGLPSSTTVVATLTNPSTLTNNDNTFTAPDNTTLSAGTTYFVVVVGDSQHPSSATLAQTSSNNEDSGGMSGFSVADNGHWKNAGATGAWNTTTDSLRIRVNGSVTASTVSSATVSGTTLKIVFDRAIDTGAKPANGAFRVISAGARIGVAGLEIAGKTVTLTLQRAVTDAETIRVGYTRPAGSLLRGTDGVEVATFTPLAVTNDTGLTRPTVTSVALVSNPRHDAGSDNSKETYGAGQAILVDVAWDRDVTWDLSAAENAGIGVRLNIGGTTRRAELVTGGAKRGTARSLRFSYTVVAADEDTDGVAVTPATGGDLVIKRHGATLNGARGSFRAGVAHAGLSTQANHKVDGDVTATANGAPTFNAEAPGDVRAPTTTLVSIPAPIIGVTEEGRELATEGFGDPDGDPLTFALSPTRNDVYTFLYYRMGRIFYQAKSDCELAALWPALTSPHNEVVTLTASDPDGASVSVTGTFQTVFTCAGPELSTVAVTNGNTLTLTFNEDLKTPSAQALRDLSWAFYAQGFHHNGVHHRNLHPSQVAVSGPTVTLTFGGMEVPPGGEAAVGYLAGIAEDLGASLQNAAGEKLAEFDGRTATRPATPTPLPPALTEVQVAGTELILTFDRALDAGSAPAGSRFRVNHRAADWYGPVTFVQGTGTASVARTQVTVTLDEAVPQGRFMMAYYTKGDDASPLRGASSGPEVADIGLAFTTVLDGTPPALVSGVVAGTRLTLSYGEALDTGSTPAPGDFAVMAGNASRTVSGVSMRASAVELTLDSAVAANQAVTVTYTAGTNAVRDLAGNNAVGLSSETVTNLGPNDPGKPTVATAAMAGAALTLTFNRALDPANVPAASTFTLSDSNDMDEWGRTVTGVAVRGSKVELVVTPGWYPCHETLKVRYDKPETGALRNLWGTQVDAFSEQVVTNTRREECIYGAVKDVSVNEGATGNKGALDMRFKRELDRRRSLKTTAFTVVTRRPGAPAIEVEDAWFAADGHGVELALSRAPAAGERVTVNYRHPREGVGLWDVDGNQIADFSAEAVAGGTTAPRPTGATTLTAAFVGMPTEHDGKKLFTFELRFSEDFPGRLRYKLLRDEAFQVTNGRVRVAKRVVKGRNQRWTISVRPASFGDVILTLPTATDCAAPGAVCTEAGRKLSRPVTATVPGPAALSVADAKAREGVDATLDFPVTLSRAATGTVTVAYVTRDGTATAGADYTRTRGKLTFAPGEREQTVHVPILDDAHDEGAETFTLKLRNAQGAAIADDTATGTIENNDPLQQAWLSRFGRTVGTHVVDAVGERLRAPSGQGSQVTVGGYRLPLDRQGGTDAGQAGDQAERAGSKTGLRGLAAGPHDSATGPPDGAAASALLEGLAGVLGLGPGTQAEPETDPWRAGPGPDPRLGSSRTPHLDLRQVLLGSSFRLALNGTDPGAATPRLTAWGRVAGTTFQGTDGNLSLDGDVLTGTVGVDGTWARWLGGLAVAHSRGDGTYTMPLAAGGRDDGTLEQTLTSLHPYLRYAVTDRLDVWGLLGYGWGEVEVAMANGGTIETDTSLMLGAFGGRGLLLAPEDTGGFQLATRTDAMFTRTSSDAAANSAATDADAHRLRVILEGSRGWTGADGQTFTPTVELGVRHDWGDAETGFGLEVGGRVQYAHPGLGLTVDAAVRGLLAHEDTDYDEWGASGTIRVAPGAQGHGVSLTLSPAWGATASGVEGLWSRQTTAGLAPQSPQSSPAGRLTAEVGYGLALFDTGLVTPYAGTVLTEGAARTARVGTRLRVNGGPATGLVLTLEGSRQEPAGAQPLNQGLRLEATWGF